MPPPLPSATPVHIDDGSFSNEEDESGDENQSGEESIWFLNYCKRWYDQSEGDHLAPVPLVSISCMCMFHLLHKFDTQSSFPLSRLEGGPSMEGFVSHFLSNFGEEKAGSLKNTFPSRLPPALAPRL
jgi:hypothetical protein